MKPKPSNLSPMQETAYKGVQKNGNGSQEAPSDLETQISWRAYDLYEKRGREDGHALEDWLEAERQMGKEVERQRA